MQRVGPTKVITKGLGKLAKILCIGHTLALQVKTSSCTSLYKNLKNKLIVETCRLGDKD